MIIKGNEISMIRGDSETIQVSCRDMNDEKIKFISGDRVYMTVKESIHTSEKLFQKVIETFTEDGDAIIEINPEDTKNMCFDTYVYDVQFVKADGKVTTIIPPNKFTILGEVTYD